jgi:hypothetical protein
MASAGMGLTPAPVAVASLHGARTAIARQPTVAGEAAAAQTVAPTKAASATIMPVQTAVRGKVARPSEPMGLVTQIRSYLDTRRVQRVAVPLIIVVAVGIVASIFVSSASKRPITEMVPEVAPPPPAQPSHASIHINSEPPGAEVVRIGDSRQLGTTPVDDIRPADGRQITYRFHLAGYTDVQMPFQASAPGKFELTATLSPAEHRSDFGGRSPTGSSRRHGHDRKHASAAIPSEAPRAAPVIPAREPMPSPTLPPLGDRNPVKRLGR